MILYHEVLARRKNEKHKRIARKPYKRAWVAFEHLILYKIKLECLALGACRSQLCVVHGPHGGGLAQAGRLEGPLGHCRRRAEGRHLLAKTVGLRLRAPTAILSVGARLSYAC